MIKSYVTWGTSVTKRKRTRKNFFIYFSKKRKGCNFAIVTQRYVRLSSLHSIKHIFTHRYLITFKEITRFNINNELFHDTIKCFKFEAIITHSKANQ